MPGLIDIKEYVFGIEETCFGLEELLIRNTTRNIRHFFYRHDIFVNVEDIKFIRKARDEFVICDLTKAKKPEEYFEIYRIEFKDGSVRYTSYEDILKIYKYSREGVAID